MLDEEHSMVVLQLVIHLFLNQACFILYFENRMSEELLFAKNEKQSPFCIKGALLLISKNDFHSYRNCKQRHLLTSFWQLEQMDVWIQKKSSFSTHLEAILRICIELRVKRGAVCPLPPPPGR